MDTIFVNNKEYKIIKLLGKGKGGYSYLAMLNNKLFVIKQIHHEPCSYYNFGNKIQSEYNDYQTLLNTNIRIPQMIDIDFDNERIVKEYIEGKTILELINKKEAINILIGIAVCIEPKLHCDTDCPFYKEEEDCKYIKNEFELEEAVKTLRKEVEKDG